MSKPGTVWEMFLRSASRFESKPFLHERYEHHPEERQPVGQIHLFPFPGRFGHSLFHNPIQSFVFPLGLSVKRL